MLVMRHTLVNAGEGLPIEQAFVQGFFEQVNTALTAGEPTEIFAHEVHALFWLWSQIRNEDIAHIQSFIAHHQQQSYAKTHQNFQAMVALYQGYLSYIQQQGESAFLQALAQVKALDNPWVNLFGTFYTQRYYLNEMQFGEALSTASSLQKQAEHLGFTYLRLEGYLELAKLHFLRMDLNLALSYLKKVITHIKEHPVYHNPRLLIPCSGYLMQIHYIVNEQEELQALLENWNPLQRETLNYAYGNIPLLIESLTYLKSFEQVNHLLSAFRGYAEEKQQKAVSQYISVYLEPFVSLLRSIHNQDQGTLQQLQQHWARTPTETAPPHRYSYALIQKLLLAFYCQDYITAAQLLDQHEARFTLNSDDSLYWVLQNYRAAILDAQGQREQALMKMVSLLRKIYQTGYIRLFADHFHGTDALFSAAVDACQHSPNPLPMNFLKGLTEALDKPELLFVSDFSEREQEVLYCLAQDMSQAKIAEHLHISKNTVKFHTKNIYKKIGAENKREARALIRRYCP